MTHPPLGERELMVLGVIGEALEQVEGATMISRDAVAHLAGGPVQGSVAVLVSYGLLHREDDPDSTEGPSLSMTSAGRAALGLERRRRRNGAIIVPRGVNGTHRGE